MNFQVFWQVLPRKISETKEFSTLKRHTKFTATYSNGVVVVRPDKTRFQRPIHYRDFSRVWNKAKTLSNSERFNPVNYQEETFHASYILALIKSIIMNDTIE